MEIHATCAIFAHSRPQSGCFLLMMVPTHLYFEALVSLSTDSRKFLSSGVSGASALSLCRLGSLSEEERKWLRDVDFPADVRELQDTGADLLSINETLEQHAIKPEVCIRKPAHIPGCVWFTLSETSRLWLSRAESVQEDLREPSFNDWTMIHSVAYGPPCVRSQSVVSLLQCW
jgi:hypothetical protein